MDLRFQKATKEEKGVKERKKSLESQTTYNTGKWSISEYFQFIKAFLLYSNDWRSVNLI